MKNVSKISVEEEISFQIDDNELKRLKEIESNSPIKIGFFTMYPKRLLNTSINKLGLSEREQCVLKLIALGHAVPEIADHLGITSNTASTYKSRIYTKLGVSSQTQAVALITAFYSGVEMFVDDGSGQVHIPAVA